MEWIDSRKRLPPLGKTVLIHCQGYGNQGNHWSSYEIAELIKPANDRRRRVFAKALDVRINDINPWIFSGMIYWQEMPTAPPAISKKEYSKITLPWGD